MSERKEKRQYTLTVEGETEKMYFEWLQKEINASQDAKYKVNINASVQPYPFSYIKRLNAISTSKVVHICDVEGNSKEDEEKFHCVLSELKDAKTQIGIPCELGYSNLTFELWLILHKQDCTAPLADRTKYLAPINSAFCEQFSSLKSYKERKNFERCLSKLDFSDVKNAVKRAKRIEENNKEFGKLTKFKNFSYYANNPALSIWKIVEEILKECLK